MNIEQLQAEIDKLQAQRELTAYDEELETKLYELAEQLSDLLLQQHAQQLAAFIAKENKWT